jgi:tartronate-semialdehyde synthase
VDVQRQEIVYEPELDAPLEVSVPKPNVKKIEKAVDMLLKAEKPIILFGGGAVSADACDEIIGLAKYLAIPVIPTIMGKGGIRPDHPLYAGQAGTRISIPPGNEIFLESDVVLAVGVRFGDRHTGDKDVYLGNRKFIHVDIEPTQIGRTIPANMAIVSDAKLALQDILKVAKKKTSKKEPTPRVKKIPEMRKKMARKEDFDNVPLYPQRIFKEMNEFFDEDTAYVTTIGLVQMLSGQFQKVYKPKRYFINSGFGCLGWDLPASIGVKIARPDLTVVDVVGDLGVSYSENQLAVASQYNVPIIVAIIDDGCLGLIRQNQELAYGFHYGIDIVYNRLAHRLTDFVTLAEAYGIAGEHVALPEEIRPSLGRALKATTDGRSYLIDFITESVDASTGLRIDKITERGYRVNPLPPTGGTRNSVDP